MTYVIYFMEDDQLRQWTTVAKNVEEALEKLKKRRGNKKVIRIVKLK